VSIPAFYTGRNQQLYSIFHYRVASDGVEKEPEVTTGKRGKYVGKRKASFITMEANPNFSPIPTSRAESLFI
jgi:hypothetical protein